jgi:tellurite resistance protein TerC
MIETQHTSQHPDRPGGSPPRSLTYAWARRIAIALVGGTVLVAGLAMTVLPGPAIVVIPAGLAILGLEFAWARRWLRTVKAKAQAAVARVNGGRS